jgi:hypothetical protein
MVGGIRVGKLSLSIFHSLFELLQEKDRWQ